MIDLTINGLRMPLAVAGQITQEYEDIGAFTLLRLGAGAAVHQESWRRTRTTLSASGLLPPGVAQRNWASPFALGCVAPRSAQAVGRVFTLPVARRSDAPPYGFAVDATGLLHPTAVSVVGDTATLAAVAGAESYQVLWYPLLIVHAPAGPRVQYDAAGAVAGWELSCEEA